MKKILCMILTLCVFAAVCVVPASAEDFALEDPFLDYCLDYYDTTVEELGDDAKVIIHDSISFANGDEAYIVFKASSWLAPAQAGYTEVMGETCVHSNVTEYPYGLGVYVYYGGMVYPYNKAVNKGIVTSIGVLNNFSGFQYHNLPEGYTEELAHRCIDSFLSFADENSSAVYIDIYSTADEYTVYRAVMQDRMYPTEMAYEKFGSYKFSWGMPVGIGENNSVGLYVMTSDYKTMTLYKAYDKGLVNLDRVAPYIQGAERLLLPFEEEYRELMMPEGYDLQLGYFYDELYYYYADGNTDGATPDYVLINAAFGPILEHYWTVDLGPYSYVQWGKDYDVYFPSEHKVYSLRTAYDAGTPGIGKVFTDSGIVAGIRGDSDGDKRITVKDATYIQKKTASLAVDTVYHEAIEFDILDIDGDNKISVKDATLIQKIVAAIVDYELPTPDGNPVISPTVPPVEVEPTLPGGGHGGLTPPDSTSTCD